MSTNWDHLSVADVHAIFDMEPSCDPDIPGLEGWWHDDEEDLLFYAHQVDGHIYIQLL
jgi:hypothetical protein